MTLDADANEVLVPFAMDSALYDGGTRYFNGGRYSSVQWSRADDSLVIIAMGGDDGRFPICQRSIYN